MSVWMKMPTTVTIMPSAWIHQEATIVFVSQDSVAMVSYVKVL